MPTSDQRRRCSSISPARRTMPCGRRTTCCCSRLRSNGSPKAPSTAPRRGSSGSGIDAPSDGVMVLPSSRFRGLDHTMKTYKIAAIPGDGIGKEVIAAGIEVLDALAGRDGGFTFTFDHFDWGSDYYKRHGVMMPRDGRDQIRHHDAIFFGAVGAPDVPDHITLWGLRLAICQPFDQYANVRPTRILPGITSPLRNVAGPELDWVIVRENSEGEYAGIGGRVHQGLPEEVATDVSLMTRAGVTRIMRFAFALARSRPRKLLTVVTKSNAQRHAMVMWDEIAAEVADAFPDVRWDKMLVDAMTMRMVIRPQSLDTIVATNLHADILSDLAAALAGSLGIAPTANLDRK